MVFVSTWCQKHHLQTLKSLLVTANGSSLDFQPRETWSTMCAAHNLTLMWHLLYIYNDWHCFTTWTWSYRAFLSQVRGVALSSQIGNWSAPRQLSNILREPSFFYYSNNMFVSISNHTLAAQGGDLPFFIQVGGYNYAWSDLFWSKTEFTILRMNRTVNRPLFVGRSRGGLLANEKEEKCMEWQWTIRPIARKAYGSIAHEQKPNGLLTSGSWGWRV